MTTDPTETTDEGAEYIRGPRPPSVTPHCPTCNGTSFVRPLVIDAVAPVTRWRLLGDDNDDLLADLSGSVQTGCAPAETYRCSTCQTDCTEAELLASVMVTP